MECGRWARAGSGWESLKVEAVGEASGQRRMRSHEGGQDIAIWGEGGLPGGRAGRQVIRRTTRVSHDRAPPPYFLHLCQHVKGTSPRWQQPLRHFPPLLFIYLFLHFLSPPLLLLLSLFFFTFYVF